MKYLKQSTAAVIPFGPALLPADGVTLVTTLVSALDNGSTGIFLAKNGSAAAIRHATVNATTYDSYGDYLVTLDATDTNTLGRLRVIFAASASTLPIWEDFTVLAANVFDSLIGGGANLKVDLDTIKTQTVTAAAGVTFPASVASPTNITAGTITTASNLTTNNDKTGYGLSAAAVQAIWDALTSALTTAGSIGKLLVDNVTASISAVKAKTDSLTFTVANQVDSNTIDWKGSAAPAMTGDAFARLGAPVGASISADVAGVPTALLDKTDGIETSWTLRQAMRIMLSALSAILSGAATTTVTIRDVGDTKDRIVATVDSDGNRTAVSYTKT